MYVDDVMSYIHVHVVIIEYHVAMQVDTYMYMYPQQL